MYVYVANVVKHTERSRHVLLLVVNDLYEFKTVRITNV